MTKKPLSQAELSTQLVDQIIFIRNSCSLFDQGCTAEGKRIAISARILVHDTQGSHSLLMQVGYMNTLQFASRAIPNSPDNLGPYLGLLNIAIGKRIRYLPKLDSAAARPMLFDNWWNEPVLKDAENTLYSRKDLVLFVANKDGGAHVDPELDEAYKKLSRSNHVGYEVAAAGRSIPWHENPVLPSLRQIAHEILETLGAIPEVKHI